MGQGRHDLDVIPLPCQIRGKLPGILADTDDLRRIVHAMDQDRIPQRPAEVKPITNPSKHYRYPGGE